MNRLQAVESAAYVYLRNDVIKIGQLLVPAKAFVGEAQNILSLRTATLLLDVCFKICDYV